jgi:hypothetical protein
MTLIVNPIYLNDRVLIEKAGRALALADLPSDFILKLADPEIEVDLSEPLVVINGSRLKELEEIEEAYEHVQSCAEDRRFC